MASSSEEENVMVENAPTEEELVNISAPEATVDDVAFIGVTCESFNYHAKVSVKNPYPVPITIWEISYILKSNTSSIASGTIPNPGSLVEGGITELVVPFKVLHGFVISRQLQNLAMDIDYQLEIRPIFDLPAVGIVTIPISTQGEIKFSSPLAITMIK